MGTMKSRDSASALWSYPAVCPAGEMPRSKLSCPGGERSFSAADSSRTYAVSPALSPVKRSMSRFTPSRPKNSVWLSSFATSSARAVAFPKSTSSPDSMTTRTPCEWAAQIASGLGGASVAAMVVTSDMSYPL